MGSKPRHRTNRGRRAPPASPSLICDIEKLVHGGAGLARPPELGGSALFVPFTLPGERVRARVTHTASGYSQGILETIEVGSPHRVEARCPIFRRCGGCHWQQIDYAQQPDLKRAILGETLLRIGAISGAILAPLPAPRSYGYRQRLRLHIGQTSGRPAIGFYAGSSHTLVPLRRCPIAHPLADDVIVALAEFLDRNAHRGLCAVEITVADDPAAVVVRYLGQGLAATERTRLFDFIAAQPHVVGQVYSDRSGERTAAGAESICADLNGLRLRISIEAFSQANWDQNRRLGVMLSDWASDWKPAAALDLFCGHGNFALTLARLGWPVLGMDQNPAAIADAEFNARANGLNGTEFRCGPVETLLGELAPGRFELVLLDPPRTGVEPATLARIAQLRAPRMVYVSCDPATLARDLKRLHSYGYRPIRLQPIDLFPQTYHLETVCELTREG